MDKRNIRVDRPELSSEEIAQKADFNEVLGRFSSTGMSGSTGGSWTAGIIAGIVLMIGLGALTDDNQRSESGEQGPRMNNQLTMNGGEDTGLETPKIKETIEPAEDNYITTPSGSEIFIPKGSMVNDEGTPVSGPVDIVYREWFDPVEVALSDIPMEYDSAGTKFIFETAGMIEIYGYQEGEPVFIDPEKPIHISMRSPERGQHFNLYELDTSTRDWTFMGKPDYQEMPGALEMAEEYREKFPEELQELEKKWKVEKGKLENMEHDAPEKPVAYNASRYHFDLDFEKGQFPGLDVFTDITFEVVPGQDVDEEIYITEWDDAELETSTSHARTETNIYILTLTKGRIKKKLKVYPVLQGEDLQEAMTRYNKAKAAHDARIERTIVNERKLRAEFEKKTDRWKAEMDAERARQQSMAEQLEAEKANRARKNAQSAVQVVREFSVRNFGVFNCDSPIFESLRKEQEGLRANFVDKKRGTALKIGMIFLIEAGRRAFSRFSLKDIRGIKWNPEKKNVIFGVTSKGKIAKFIPLPGETIPRNATYYEFAMEVSDDSFDSPDEVKEYLGLEF